MIAAPVAALTPVLPGKGDQIVVVGLRRLGDGWFHHTGRSHSQQAGQFESKWLVRDPACDRGNSPRP